MTQNNELEMKVPRRARSERARTSTGVGAPQGRRRTVDIDENNVYHSFSLKLSDSLNRRLGLAVSLTGMNKREFIITNLEPAIKQVLEEHGIRIETTMMTPISVSSRHHSQALRWIRCKLQVGERRLHRAVPKPAR